MTNQSATYKDKLQDLRNVMDEQGVDGVIVPRADEYQGEFLAAYSQRLPWLTGFTGSGGVAVILRDKAVVLTDGRYIIQVKQQVDGDMYDTGDITQVSVGAWLAEHCSNGDVIACDPWLHTPEQIDKIEKVLEDIKDKDIHIVAKSNFIDKIWKDQPDKPDSIVEIFPEFIAGSSSVDKRAVIVKQLKEKSIYAVILTLPDSIAWMLNIRGNDVPCIPLILSYATIDSNGNVQLFIDEARISKDVLEHMGDDVEIIAPCKIEEHIEILVRNAQVAGQAIGVDYTSAPLWFKECLKSAGAQVTDLKDPCILPKSLKSESEQVAIRQAHIMDGVALVKFLYWLDMQALKGVLTELDIAEKLEEFRTQCEDYRGASFPVIAGFGVNAAIVHYRATKESYATLLPSGLLLVDSGGQYLSRDLTKVLGGTTDITRTIVIGSITDEARDNFTRVLKGHIAVASAIVPKGTLGVDIDALARAPLQEAGLDYAHGTGHGVGVYLAVHEPGANFSPKGKEEVRANMLISNEPGYYKEGEYGIRIENLVLVKEVGSGQLCFETVSLAPIDRRAINKVMMTTKEIEWLDRYHKMVWEKLSCLLDEDTKIWLREQTRSL
ncbi:MAG: aminopeptidase P family protein [Alphaproteobacteria bacterium]|nr:aminopeptidase P family protein [Alphaproteobacteria bacterium]